MAALKRFFDSPALALAILLSVCLLAGGCKIQMGVKSRKVRTDEERKPVSASGSGQITSDVQMGQGDQVVLTLTRDQKEEVSTVEWHQAYKRHFDLSGLFIGLGFGIAGLFILGIIALINNGGSSSSSSSWDWD